MATFPGVIPARADQEWLHDRVTRNFDRYAADYYPYKDMAAPLGPGAAARIINLPVSQQARPLAGMRGGSFASLDWYDRIHLIPGVLALGNLVQAQERTIEVWNAWFVPQRLASVAGSDDTGLTLTQPVAAPTMFGALESRLYTLAISLDGPPTVHGHYVFTFAAQAPTLHITGARVLGFSFRPNWREPVMERLAYLTDVLAHRDGTEQRVRLRQTPRREIEYLVTLTGAQAARLDAALWGWQARVWALPIWTDPHILPAALSAGATSVTVPTQYKDYAADHLAMLVADDGSHEVVEVATVLSGSLTLARPTAATWPAGTRLFPARLARLPAQVKVARHSAAVAEATLRFAIEPMQALGGIEGAAATQYLAEDVYLTAPNWAGALDGDVERAMQIIDGQTGPLAVDDPAGQPAIVRTYRWLLQGRPAISAHRFWLLARSGRLKPGWVPTWTRDLELAVTAGSSATTLIVQDIGYRTWYAQAPGRRDLAVRLPSGAWALRRIVGADQVVAGQERIQIDSALGVAIDPGAWITFIGLHRLDADRVEMAWHSAEVVQMAANLRLVKE